MNVVTMSGEIKFQGDVGPRGPKGEKGDKPVAGVDYYTKAEKEQFLAEITEDANSVFNKNVLEKTTSFNSNATSKTQAYNKNADEKTEDFTTYTAQKKTEFESYVGTKTEAFNSNVTSKTASFNSNVTSQLNTFNSNANTKQTQFNTNATQKTDDFDENAEQQTKDFNENVSDKTTAFNNNVTQKTTAFDNNAVEKTTAFDTNVETKTTAFNENTVKETDAFNENAQNKLDEFNSSANIQRITTLEGQVEKLEKKVDQAEAILPITTASGEYVYIDNAVNYPLIGLSGEGKCEQGENPSPDNPQEITTIEEAEYKKIKKNVLKKYSNSGSLTASGITITQNEDGTFTLNGTATATLRIEYISNFKNGVKYEDHYSILLDSSKNYTHSIVLLSGSITGDNVTSTLGTNLIADSSGNKGARIDTPITFSGSEGISRGFLAIPSGVVINNAVIGVQLEVGTEATPYEPYQETTLPIDLQGNELCKVGDVSDKLLIDRKGNVAIEKNIEETILTGAENWNMNNGTSLFSFTKINNSKKPNSKNCISSYYIYDSRESSMTGLVNNTFALQGNYAGWFFKDTRFTDVESFKTWVTSVYEAGKPIVVYCERKIAEIINLGTIENPEIFKGINNIAVETNLGNMNVEIEYVEDLQARLEKLEQAIISLGGI